MPVVIALPSSTMNITGFLNWSRGSSFGNESRAAARTSSRENTPERRRARAGRSPSTTSRPSQVVEREVELEDVHAGLAEEAPASGRRCAGGSGSAPSRAGACRTAAIRRDWSAA